MNLKSEKLNNFVSLLTNIFELDKADLDFGIYRIMNIRKNEISEFLSVGLPQRVQDTLSNFVSNTAETHARIAEIEKQAADIGFDISKSKLADEYALLKSQLTAGIDSDAIETDVYSALYNFFCRYYDEGDFISKRRYKEGVYAIPYEGEEVKLYWANSEQYYIKTAENFRDYSFFVDGKKAHFRIVDATTERNNNKENGAKRTFMLYEENASNPGCMCEQSKTAVNSGIKAIEEVDGELVIRFIYDLPVDKKKKYTEENLAAISDTIQKDFKDWLHLLAPASTAKGEKRTIIEKHLKTYVAKNTFDYFIHKDLRGFLTRELDFFIKSEVIHLEDIDTPDITRVDIYMGKVRAIKRVGKIIIDFLTQLEEFQKKLWLKKKFVIDTNWCITLDRVDECFYPEITENAEQITEWAKMYAIKEIEGGLTVDFLRQNRNLVLDTWHFTADFKDRLLASIDNLDEQTGGLLIHSENFQALRLLQERYEGNIDFIHIDPPYNTDTSPFPYKNSYRHSSWASMMNDRLVCAYNMLNEQGSYLCHIDENEYELLHSLFDLLYFQTESTIIWNKLNPMLGGTGVAVQHEYIIFRSLVNDMVYASSETRALLKEYAVQSIESCGGVNDKSRKMFTQLVLSNNDFTGGDKAYRLLDDDGKVYRLVAMGAPEKRTDPKFYIPLKHPFSGKPCPVPGNGWSRTPETIQGLIEEGMIVFGKDETTQPQKKVYLNGEANKQLSSVINDGTSGKVTLDNLGLTFPYAHPISLYEFLQSINNPQTTLDFFAGSGTTGHAILNLNRSDGGNRKYILVEMGEYFNTVTLPRMKKVIYSADWKNGNPQNRNTGVSHIMKYITLESYEDALSNIKLSDEMAQIQLHLPNGEARLAYMLYHMFDFESRDSLLNLDAFALPFTYKLRINENNETKDKTVDLPETFNYLLGLSVVRQSAISRFTATRLTETEWRSEDLYESSVRLTQDAIGEFAFKQIEGRLPDGKRALVIWRTITSDLLRSNAALDAYFIKNRMNLNHREVDLIFVNGDNNLENLLLDEENWKVQRIEPVFKKKMFEGAK